MLYKDVVQEDQHRFYFVGKTLDGMGVVEEKAHRPCFETLATTAWPLYRYCVAQPSFIGRVLLVRERPSGSLPIRETVR